MCSGNPNGGDERVSGFSAHSIRPTFKNKLPRFLKPMNTATMTTLVGSGLFAILSFTSLAAAPVDAPLPDRPNFVWITSEDDSPLFGFNGDPVADTPRLDALAAKGFVYTNAFANAPVCAPARVTLFTGRYASTLGLESMRSWYQVPEFRNYAGRFRMAGYYTSNNAKTDYNHDGYDPGYWDASSKTAHYRDRGPKQTFFHVWSSGRSHEWNIWNLGDEPIQTNPEVVTVPPYLPDTPLIRRQLARDYDTRRNADAEIGAWLDELEADGRMEDTIIFYFADHGGAKPRSKRFLYDTGTRVPLIVYIPEKYKHLWPAAEPGSEIDRLVSFVDFAPTVLSLADLPIPDFMQGTPFLGEQAEPEVEDVYLFRGRMDLLVDFSRALRTPRYLYIRNYMPHRPNGLFNGFQFRQASYVEWLNLFEAGKLNPTQSRFFEPKAPEELYDVAADPWQVRNLAKDPEYQALLGKMRVRLRERIRETGDISFVSEIRREALLFDQPLRTAVDDGDIPIERVIETADLAGWADPANLPELIVRLEDPDPSVAFWAATGLAALGSQAAPAREALLQTLQRPSWEAKIPAAEALYYLGERDVAMKVLLESLEESARVAVYGANALNAINRFFPLDAASLDGIRPLFDQPRGQIRSQPAWAGFSGYDLTASLLRYVLTNEIPVEGLGSDEVTATRKQSTRK